MLLPRTALDRARDRVGTRFWIFPQAPFLPGYEQPDRVWLPILPDTIGEGPSDARMYVADPLLDKEPYRGLALPPFDGQRRAPPQAGPDRHFDHLDPLSRSYLGVHAFACVRFVLDVWENYLGRPVRWFFDGTFERLEIIPAVRWQNAQAGFGYLELGYGDLESPVTAYALNFDSIAHETGHFIVLSEIGIPAPETATIDFFAASEALADIISLVSFLHFDSAMDRLLRRTNGNLLMFNELNRFAETSPETQIRVASNARRAGETTNEVHDRSLPFTGAVFDSIVELYHDMLVRTGAADERLNFDRLRSLSAEDLQDIGDDLAAGFRKRPLFFKSALASARDAVGSSIAGSLCLLPQQALDLPSLSMAVTASAQGRAAEILEENFVWRGYLT